MATDSDIRLLTSPRIFLVGMAAFLALVGFVVLILYKQIALAFSANPGLNGLILGILAIGSLFTFRQVIRLFREIHWVNSLTGAAAGRVVAPPLLLAPMKAMLNAGAGARGLSTITTRAILDSIATRLDEGRELSRYLVGLLVFLGLLETVHSISGVIESMKTGADTSRMFEDLKIGLSAPIAGMSVSFTSSLFGLASSLILGFLDLQAGQAQNRFYSEFEEFLASHVQTTPAVVDPSPEPEVAIQPMIEHQRNAAAIATLAEGIQALVGHMRTEQQQIRNWVDVQAQQQEDIGKLLRRLLDELTTP